jgi:hypothetical protein
VARLLVGVGFETLLTLKVEESSICLMGARRPSESTVEKTVDLFLENINNNKAFRSLPIKGLKS